MSGHVLIMVNSKYLIMLMFLKKLIYFWPSLHGKTFYGTNLQWAEFTMGQVYKYLTWGHVFDLPLFPSFG